MPEGNLFLAQLFVGKCHLTAASDKKINLTFRVGKNSVQASPGKIIEDGVIHFDTTLQLNIDKCALDTQRCSLTLAWPGPISQAPVIGIIFLSLAKDNSQGSKKYKITQCQDKNAEIDLALRVIQLDSMNPSQIKNSSIMSPVEQSGISGKGSIMQMKQFEKMPISPPKLFNESNGFQSQTPPFLLPPKPRSSREKTSDHRQSTSYCITVQQDKFKRLEDECKCLKQLLRLQIKKNSSANQLIQKLVQALQNSTKQNSLHQSQNENELEESFLLDNLDHDEKIAELQEKMQLHHIIEDLTKQLDKLKVENKHLTEQIASAKKIEETLPLLQVHQDKQQKHHKIQRGMKSPDVSDSRQKDAMKKLQQAQRTILQTNRKLQKLRVQMVNLEGELMLKETQLERYKKKMKIESKFSSLKCIEPQKAINFSSTIKNLYQRSLTQRKQMLKLLLKSFKQENESINQTTLNKIKQKIQKCFTSLIAKKLTKQVVLQEKVDILKGIQEILQIALA